MISIGNKIEVIASSTKGKGAKIRKGSLGYVSTTSTPSYIGGGGGMFTGNLLVTPAKVIFTRFGHERKPRSEVKFVALIHPVINPKTIKNKKTYLERIVKQALDYTQEIKEIFKREGIKINKVNAIAVHTVNTTENVTISNNECSSWVRSIALSGILHNLLFIGPNDPSRRTLDRLVANNTQNLDWLHTCVSSKTGVKQYVDHLFEGDKKELKPFVFRMQELLQLNRLQELQTFKVFKPTLANGGVVYGMCWRLCSMSLMDNVEKGITSSNHVRRAIEQTRGWFDAYNEIAKKSV